MAPSTFHNPQERSFTVVLINTDDNPVAVIEERSFKGDWHWLKTPKSWKPGDPLPADPKRVDALIVFAAKHREDEVGRLCRSVREVPELGAIPLLIAVDQYQMPVANRMRELPNTDFVLTPIEEASLARHLNRAVDLRSQ